MMTQEEIFQQVYEKYKNVLPEIVHGSGGLPDTKGLGTSDVDICVRHENHQSLAKYFPEDTEIDSSSKRTIYKLNGYDREVNMYCSVGEWWDHGARHRKTELTLKAKYPELAVIAFSLKKSENLSTEEAWAKTLGLGDDFHEILLDTEEALEIAEQVSK